MYCLFREEGRGIGLKYTMDTLPQGQRRGWYPVLNDLSAKYKQNLRIFNIVHCTSHALPQGHEHSVHVSDFSAIFLKSVRKKKSGGGKIFVTEKVTESVKWRKTGGKWTEKK